jgi:hypothetical protein
LSIALEAEGEQEQNFANQSALAVYPNVEVRFHDGWPIHAQCQIDASSPRVAIRRGCDSDLGHESVAVFSYVAVVNPRSEYPWGKERRARCARVLCSAAGVGAKLTTYWRWGKDSCASIEESLRLASVAMDSAQSGHRNMRC